MKDKCTRNLEYENNYGLNLNQCKLLGMGNHGKVYLIASDRVIKVCKDSKSCIYESFILTRTNVSKYFPKIYDYDEHFIIREYVDGEPLNSYIKKNGLNNDLINKIICLAEEFYSLGFTKIDIRCRDIMVRRDESLMVIDPKGSYTRNVSYPRHLMKGLNKLGVLEDFIDFLKEHRFELFKEWIQNFSSSQPD